MLFDQSAVVGSSGDNVYLGYYKQTSGSVDLFTVQLNWTDFTTGDYQKFVLPVDNYDLQCHYTTADMYCVSRFKSSSSSFNYFFKFSLTSLTIVANVKFTDSETTLFHLTSRVGTDGKFYVSQFSKSESDQRLLILNSTLQMD